MVLVRSWRSARGGGGGCCSAGSADVFLDHEPTTTAEERSSGDPVARTYRSLRTALPAADVQVVSASNTVYLLPWAYRAARVRLGRLRAVRAAMHATTAGTVLVDGVPLGEVDALGADGILARLDR